MGDRRSTACWWYSKVAKQLEYYHELQAVDRGTTIPDRGLLTRGFQLSRDRKASERESQHH